MNTTKRSIPHFFLLVFALIVPFWAAGALTGGMLLPGLPLAALAAFCPAVAALLLVYRSEGGTGVRALLKRAFDFRRIERKAWYVPILLIMPGVMTLSFLLLRLIGVPVPAPHFSLLTVLGLCAFFFIGALGEELGWSGYVIDPMQERWGALNAALLLGAVQVLFHSVPLLQAGRSAEWIAWWSLYSMAGRVIVVWIYNNTGRSVFGVTLYHMLVNVTWQLFPVEGSYFDPQVTGSILGLLAVVIVLVWGPGLRERSQETMSS